MVSRAFTPGVLVPLTTPFKPENSDVDIEALKAGVVRIAKAGMGIVLMGTNGEASHLNSEERMEIISSARSALDEAGLNSIPLLVGTGAGSARASIKLAEDAKKAGADFTIVIAPGYFSFVMGKDRQALHDFFTEVADKSPLPVMIYNFPGAAAGIDLDSDLIIALSEHQNIIGVKLTCAGIGKGARISKYVQTEEYKKRHPTPFLVMPGFTDYLLPSLVARGDGCITGTGNIIPKTIAKLYQLSTKALSSGKVEDLRAAQELQDLVSQADWIIVKAGIPGTKYALDQFATDPTGKNLKLGGAVRSPLTQVSDATRKLINEGMRESVEYEKSLP
ncbi:DapA-like [Phaffia rhodozyma]|uniref:DapA-like n=1 Tax=Phaffia rhodozyma TaxID=264483 RepID=A0A0F7SLR2_PHARH|nr:DapA-like [Phaffia rhodozyma]